MPTQSLKVLYVVIFSIIAFFSPMTYAAQVHGILTVVKGKVMIKSGKTGKEERAKAGMKVYPKDSISTQDDSRAKIVMVDKNEINVSPGSQVVIATYEFDPSKDNKKVLLDVLYGKVRAKVEQKYDSGDNKFQVKTPSAVAGVRGTDFFTSYNKVTNSSKVVTFKGEVAFGLPGPGGTILNPVAVKVGQFTVNTGNKPPAPAAAMPQSELAKFDVESKAESSGSENKNGPGDNNNQPNKGEKDNNKKETGNKGEKEARSDSDGGDKGSKKADQGKNDPGKKGDKQGNSSENKSAQQQKDPRQSDSQAQGNNASGERDSTGSPNKTSESNSARNSEGKGPQPGLNGPSGGGPGSERNGAPIDGGGLVGGIGAPGSSAGREPSSMMPPLGGGTGMMRPEDFASAPTMPGFVGMPPPPMMPFMPLPVVPGTNVICEFCREVIQDGSTRLIIRVTNGSGATQ